MFKFLLVLAVLSVALSARILEEDKHTHLNFDDIMKVVNQAGSTWVAGIPTRWANATHADVKMSLGTIMPEEEGYEGPESIRSTFRDASIPENFDVRTNWPECAAVTGHVRDQSSCGSCWAFGSTEAFNDRYCIRSGDASTLFSPEDTAACCSGLSCSMSQGCNGGQPAGAWKWFQKTGVVSGGDFSNMGDGSSCQPYSLQACAHHVAPTGDMVACDSLPEFPTPKCTKECETNYGVSFEKDKHFATGSYGIKGTENMQKELMEKGTLSVAFTVYEDFEAYTGGIYQHKTGKSLGGHAVKMVGWGVENGTPYWTCINSWNDTWGEQGAFRILRGSNECGIEGSVVAGDA